MELRSLGYRTDLIFINFDGEVIDRGNYLVLKTLSSPNYFWGNLLIFDQPPKAGDLKKWKELFRKEFPNPRIYHQTFAWDFPEGADGEIAEFLTDGFNYEKGVVLSTARVIQPPKFDPAVEVRPITTDAEWARAVEIQIACGLADLSTEQLRKFYTSQMQRYRYMVQADMGQWFGAFLKGEQVGGLGVFAQGDLARFQMVSTHPAYQRQGVCASLVYHTARFALDKLNVKKLVMVADEEYHAARIYESVGFTPTEKLQGLCWYDRNYQP